MRQTLKYGENPHQAATIVLDENSRDPLALSKFKIIGADTASASPFANVGWVNLKDLSRGLDAIVRVAAAYEKNVGNVPHIAILVGHGNPFGAACGSSEQVIATAIQSDFRAAFGSFIITNVPVSEPVAYKMRQWMGPDRPFSGIAAPLIDEAAISYFVRRKGQTVLMANPALATLGLSSIDQDPITHTIRGATLTQEPNRFVPTFPAHWDRSLKEDMSLAWGICAASASNCITIAKDQMLVANAVGQQERAAAGELAIQQAREAQRSTMIEGAAAVSDSFFTFADAFDYLARRKVKAVFATHGSIHDAELLEHAKLFNVELFTVPDVEGRIFAGH